MKRIPLSERLRGRIQPAGYVSFLSALIHRGALVDSLSSIQVASPDAVGRDRCTNPGPVDFIPIPRDLFYGWI